MRKCLPLLFALLLVIPAPSLAQNVKQDELDQIQTWLSEGSAEERIKGSKWLRGHSLPEDADAWLLPSLTDNLEYDDPDVRKWTVLALATRGDVALPILKDALPDETDDVVKNQIQATIRHMEQAAEKQEWLANHPCSDLELDDVEDWEVRELCDPLGKYPPVIVDLGDGTFIYGSRHQADDKCFRGKRKKKCHKRCLPPGARLSTPAGPRTVEEMEIGDPIWTSDANGKRVEGVVLQTGTITVTSHQVMRVTLEDGRTVVVSGQHPTADGRFISDLVVGDPLDGSLVTRLESIPLEGTLTFDVLPSGETGSYWADDVLLGSTLLPQEAVSVSSP